MTNEQLIKLDELREELRSAKFYLARLESEDDYLNVSLEINLQGYNLKHPLRITTAKEEIDRPTDRLRKYLIIATKEFIENTTKKIEDF